MKCGRAALIKALDVLKHVAHTKKNATGAEITIADIVLSAENSSLRIEAQAWHHRAIIAIPCEGDLPPTPVTYRTFTKLVKAPKKTKGQDIAIVLHDRDEENEVWRGLRVTIGKRKFTVPNGVCLEDRMKPIDVPSQNGGAHISLRTPQLARSLGFIRAAVCKDETRFHLTGACWVDGFLVATDGHRLHISHAEEFKKGKDTYEPISRVETLDTLIAGIKAASPQYVMARYFEQKVLEFHLDGTLMDIRIIERVIDSTFPPYKQVIPKMVDAVRMENGANLREAAKLAIATYDGKDSKDFSAHLTLNSSLRLKTESYEEELDLLETYDGKATTIGVNPIYLVEAIPFEDEELEIGFQAASDLDPVLLTHNPGSPTPDRAVVMPRRIE
jgi:DNA polymerase III sliding clamp (beta) subunit (PCNA family)